MTSASISGTTITIATTGTPANASICYVTKGHYAEEEGDYQFWAGANISGDTITSDLNDAPAGTYYIAAIELEDAAGNSSVYYGYDTDLTFWSGTTFSELGYDFTKFNRYKGLEAPEITAIDNLTFTWNGFAPENGNIGGAIPAETFTGEHSFQFTTTPGVIIDGGAEIDYTYTSDGILYFDAGTEMRAYYNTFMVSNDEGDFLILGGFKKTAGDLTSIVGTYESKMDYTTFPAGPSTVTTTITLTLAADGNFTVLTSVNGSPTGTESGTWDPATSSFPGFGYAIVNSTMYMYSNDNVYTMQ